MTAFGAEAEGLAGELGSNTLWGDEGHFCWAGTKMGFLKGCTQGWLRIGLRGVRVSRTLKRFSDTKKNSLFEDAHALQHRPYKHVIKDENDSKESLKEINKIKLINTTNTSWPDLIHFGGPIVTKTQTGLFP